MSQETMQQTVDFILANRCSDRLTIVTFYGGESLLALGQMKWMVTTLREHLGDKVGFSISTNGWLLSRETVDWICAVSDMHVYVTVDGYRELHDRNRVTAASEKTFDTILGNLKYFKERYPAEYEQRVNFLVTLGHWGQLPEVSARWSENEVIGDKIPKHLSFILPKNVDEMRHPATTIDQKRAVLDEAFAQYCAGKSNLLTKMFVEWTDNVTRNSRSILSGDEMTVVTCVEDLYRIFVSAEGHLYVCERFCSEHRVGHVADGVLPLDAIYGLEQRFIHWKSAHCGECHAREICSFCMTHLNYTEAEREALCATERQTALLIKEYAWRRRRHTRLLQLESEQQG